MLFMMGATYLSVVHADRAEPDPLDWTQHQLRRRPARAYPLVARDLRNAIEEMRGQGVRLVEALDQAEYLQPSAVHLLSAGEESDALDRIYGTLARYYDEEVAYRIDTLGALIEPALLLMVSLIVGTVLIAVFCPSIRSWGK